MITNSDSQRTALFIDTSDENAQVTLVMDGKVVDSIVWLISFAAGKEVLEKVNKILNENNTKLSDINRIAVHSGPGKKSSTLRSGITVATFLAYTSGAELVVANKGNQDELVNNIFSASAQTIVKPIYDKPGFDMPKKKA